jgi:hypothetical protein
MVFTEIVKVTDPESGRLCKVFLTEDEVKACLTVVVTTMLHAGLVAFTQQKEGVDLSKLDTEDSPMQ